MSRLIKGKEFSALVDKGLTIEEIAKMYGCTTQNVKEAIRKYNHHIDLYNNCTVYRDLYNQYKSDYGDKNEGGVVTRALNTLRRIGAFTKEDIISNKEKILNGNIRKMGKSTKELIKRTYFSNEPKKTDEIVETRKLKPVLDNASALSLITGICEKVITDYAVGKVDLNYTDVCKINLALVYLRNSSDSLYAITSMMITHHNTTGTLENFLCELSKINVDSKDELIKFFMNNI